MSKKKDRERAKEFVYRSGERVPRRQWDKHQRELIELLEEQRLKALGLIKGKPRIVTAERAGLEKKQVMTPSELRR